MGMVALHMMFSILLLLLLVKNAGLDQGDNFVEFTEKTAYLLAIMLIALLVMESSPRLGRRKAFMLGAGIGLVSILLALVSLVAESIPCLLPSSSHQQQPLPHPCSSGENGSVSGATMGQKGRPHPGPRGSYNGGA